MYTGTWKIITNQSHECVLCIAKQTAQQIQKTNASMNPIPFSAYFYSFFFSSRSFFYFFIFFQTIEKAKKNSFKTTKDCIFSWILVKWQRRNYFIMFVLGFFPRLSSQMQSVQLILATDAILRLANTHKSQWKTESTVFLYNYKYKFPRKIISMYLLMAFFFHTVFIQNNILHSARVRC